MMMVNITLKIFQVIVCMNYKMLEYNKIDISEGIDMNKTSVSKEYHICHYWYFLDKNFNYEPYLCNGCHDLMQKAMNFNDIATYLLKGMIVEFIFGIGAKMKHYIYCSLYIKGEWNNLLSKKQRSNFK